MKIGINAWYLNTPNSGIGQYTLNLVNALSEIDNHNSYFIFTPSPCTDINFPENFKIIHLKPTHILKKTFINRYLWEEFQLGYAIKKYNIQVFHGFYQSLPRGSEKIANVVTIHDAIPWRFPFERKNIIYRWYNERRRKNLRLRAQKVITISETTKLDLAPIYRIKPETIEVTYESANPSFSKKYSHQEITEFKKQFNIEREYIVYTGGLKRHKNLRMLIKSFNILAKEFGYKGDLYLIGAVRNNMAVSSSIYYRVEDLEKYAKLKKINKSIKFVGLLSQDEISMFIHQAKCYISVSLYEGFGLPALEAMMAGTPTVLSNLGAYTEICQEAAEYVYPYGPHRIAEGINKVLTDENLRNQLINRGLERAQFFNRIKIAKRILEIYKEVYDDYKIKFEP
jgi:glycosyltransferase involved in cell wall biosynthesis